MVLVCFFFCQNFFREMCDLYSVSNLIYPDYNTFHFWFKIFDSNILVFLIFGFNIKTEKSWFCVIFFLVLFNNLKYLGMIPLLSHLKICTLNHYMVHNRKTLIFKFLVSMWIDLCATNVFSYFHCSFLAPQSHCFSL